MNKFEQKIEVTALEDADRLNNALKRLHISHKTFKKYYYKDLIRVDGKWVKHIDPVKKGSVISFRIPGFITPIGLKANSPKVLYEDDMIFLIEKPAGVLTHESRNHFGVNLKDMVSNLFNEREIFEPVRFINRLDMDTSGIIMIAKNDISQGFYQKLHNENLIKKEYICIASSKEPLLKKTIVNVKIGRDEIGIKRKAVYNDEEGLDAKTIFTPIYFKNGIEILKAEIKTGRTHQIRVHLGTLGKVLLGDELYGGDKNLIKRQALHSFRLRTKDKDGNSIDVFSELPEDMKRIIEMFKDEI